MSSHLRAALERAVIALPHALLRAGGLAHSLSSESAASSHSAIFERTHSSLPDSAVRMSSTSMHGRASMNSFFSSWRGERQGDSASVARGAACMCGPTKVLGPFMEVVSALIWTYAPG